MLPKKRLSPRTVILKEGKSLFIGGLARIDYIQVIALLLLYNELLSLLT